MREDQPWSFLYNYSKWKLLLLSCLKFLWWDKLNNRFTIYTTTSCWINLLTYKHTRVRTETLTIHLIYEESGMNCYVLCATILHPAIVYLDPQNYNINFKVSRSFLYKCTYKLQILSVMIVHITFETPPLENMCTHALTDGPLLPSLPRVRYAAGFRKNTASLI